MQKLPRSFYTRRTITVAKELLGKIFVRKIGRTILKGMIVETEAYLFDDPACHAFRGMTKRTKVMFEQGGYLYVYFTYGLHHCANIVTYKEGIGEAVLIRAVEPVDGIDVMIKNRTKNKVGVHLKGGLQLQNLTNGPAKFAQAFALTTKESGINLTGSEIFIAENVRIPTSKIIATTRIGINVATEKRWRFYIKGNGWVSRK